MEDTLVPPKSRTPLYLDPEPCTQGHTPCWRYVKTKMCIYCKRGYYRRNESDHKERMRAYHEAHPEYNRDVHLARHGLTFGSFTKLLDDQDGLCAVCKSLPGKRRFDIDHDHSCCPGRDSCGFCIRGLLCQTCNTKTMAAVDLMVAWGMSYDQITSLPGVPTEVKSYLSSYARRQHEHRQRADHPEGQGNRIGATIGQCDQSRGVRF